MKNKICVSALLIILIVTMLSFSACDRVEYCTVTVEGFTVPNHVYEFRVVKGERFTVGQLFNSISHGFLSTGMDIVALYCDESYTQLYDESQPVESDMKLYALSGMTNQLTYVTATLASDRLKALYDEIHRDENNSINKYSENLFICFGVGEESNILKVFGIDAEGIEYKIENNETIYDDYMDLHDAIYDFDNVDENGIRQCGSGVFCTPNLHYHIPHVHIYLY